MLIIDAKWGSESGDRKRISIINPDDSKSKERYNEFRNIDNAGVFFNWIWCGQFNSGAQLIWIKETNFWRIASSEYNIKLPNGAKT